MLSQISLRLFVLSQKRYAPSPKQAENRHSPQISPELTRDVVEEFFLFEWPIFCNFFIALSTEVCMWWKMFVPLQVMTFPTVDSSLLPMAHDATCKKIQRSLNPLYFTSSCTEDYKDIKFEYGHLRLLSTLSLPDCPGYGQWVASQLRSGIQRLSTGTRNFTITISHSEAEILVDSLHRDWTLTGESAVQL